MCNCQSEITESVKKSLAEKPDTVSVVWCIPNYTFTENAKAVIDVNCAVEKRLKNGNTKRVEGNTNLIATYCPFCGVKYDTE